MHLLARLLPPAFCLLFLLPCTAAADTVVINSGFVEIGGAFPPGRGTFRSINFKFAGAGFSAQGSQADGTIQQLLHLQCTVAPCAPGTAVNGSSNAALQGTGSASVNGVGSLTAFYDGSTYNFTLPDLLIPDSTLSTITLQTPFTMTGNLGIDALVSGSRQPIFSANVTGQGIATLTLSQFNFNGTTGYVLHTIRYDFDAPTATPEPTALVLLGTGLAGLAARRRRRTRA